MEAVRRSRQRSADNRKRRYSFPQSIPRCSAILRYLSLVRLTSLAYFAFLGSSAGVRPFFFASANIRSCRSRLSTIADDPVSSCRCFTVPGCARNGEGVMDVSLLMGAPIGLGILLAAGILMVVMSYLTQ